MKTDQSHHVHTCIVVDDEHDHRQLLAELIADVPALKLMGLFPNAHGAIDWLRQQPIDLVFLDIEMIGMNGIDLAERLVKGPQVIFVTGHPQYAVSAFEVEAVDYLLKPVTLVRLRKALEKYFAKHAAGRLKSPPDSPVMLVKEKADTPGEKFLYDAKKYFKLTMHKVTHLETDGNYVKIHMENGSSTLQLTSLTKFYRDLPKDTFIRVHRSHVINRSYVDSVDGNRVRLSTGGEVPIGRTYQRIIRARLRRGYL